MKITKKYLLAIPAFALAGLVSATAVSAASDNETGMGPGMMGGRGGMHGGFGMGGGELFDADRLVERLTAEASILGISVDEMKTYWSQGKNLQEIATEKGITAEQLRTKMQAAAETKIQTQLKTLVDKGVITQAQADSRLATMKARQAKMAEHMKTRVEKHATRATTK